MERSTVEDSNAPESWEVADVEESMKRLLLSSSKDSSAAKDSSVTSSTSNNNNNNNNNSSVSADDFASNSLNLGFSSGGVNSDNAGLSEDAINSVDQFLREALQNPRERLSILRMEQDVEQFIQDPMRQQMEFQQLPTSYLRLAAHRVAQHYFLQSMVLLDNSLPDGSGSRIIVQKTSTECRLPRIRLADIPVNLPQEDGVVKVAIKQRPQKHSSSGGGNSGSQKSQNSKSVEERKEEYNRARARIFNSNNHNSSPGAKAEIEPKKADSLQLASLALPRVNEKSASGVSDLGSGRALAVVDSPSGSSRSARNRTEKEPVNRNRSNNRVAIFRDREIDRKDPDYDRNYDRYLQRFDPGFGFNAGPYTVQPMYTPAVNYNTEFPQLGVTPRPQISADLQRPIPQHIPGPWTSPSNPAGLAYGHPEAMMAAYNPSHVNPRSASAIYLHTTQFPCQRPGMPFIHPHEHIHQAYQSQQQQHDATLGFARPR